MSTSLAAKIEQLGRKAKVGKDLWGMYWDDPVSGSEERLQFVELSGALKVKNI